MARGGYGQGDGWGSLSDRLAASGAPTGPPQAAAEPPAVLKHCWVVDSRGKLPALLIGWRQVDGAWEGRVVRPFQTAAGGWLIEDVWLPADQLEPIG